MPYTFTVLGSLGQMIVNSTGLVLKADVDYEEITHIDVAEWRVKYPNERLCNGTWDCLDFGGWSINGQYFEPKRGHFND